jgi:hypothetical protein
MNIYLLDHEKILHFAKETHFYNNVSDLFQASPDSVFGWGLIDNCVIFLTPHSKFMDIALQ